jgi:putative two-component system response regulator
MNRQSSFVDAFDFGNASLIDHLESMMRRAYQGSGYCLIEHGQMVGEVAAQIAEALEYPFTSVNRIDPIRLAGRFHDIGKVMLEEEIRLRTGGHSRQELLKFQAHPVLGAEILRDLGVNRFIVDAVLFHHVHFAGGGYPRCFFSGEAIPLIARIIAVADFFVSGTEERGDRPGEDATVVWKELLERRGTWFDPAVVDAFNRTPCFKAAIGFNQPRLVLDPDRSFPLGA